MRVKPAFCTPLCGGNLALTIRGQKRVLLPPFSEVFTESSQKGRFSKAFTICGKNGTLAGGFGIRFSIFSDLEKYPHYMRPKVGFDTPFFAEIFCSSLYAGEMWF